MNLNVSGTGRLDEVFGHSGKKNKKRITGKSQKRSSKTGRCHELSST